MSALPDLENMDREALLALWAATLGGDPPARLSQPFLRRMLAWELQAREQGGLPAPVRRKLESLAAGTAKPAAPKMKAGGRFLREWNGVTHVVYVVEGGFVWRGERHRSLSAIARAITGAHWSGPRFFGLQEGAGISQAKGRKASPAGGTTPVAKPTAATARSKARKAASHAASRRAA